MGKIQNFTDLNAWQEAHQLALAIYKVTKGFPRDELLSLTNQMRRSAVSIASNLAEGFNRLSKKEKTQFYSIVMGSAGELQSQLLLARDLGYISQNDYQKISNIAETVRKLTAGLSRSLRG